MARRRLSIPLRLSVLFVLILASSASSAQAGIKLSTRVRRAWQALIDRIPPGLRPEHREVNRLFEKTLVRDPTTRTGLGELSALERRLRERVPEAVQEQIRTAPERSPLAYLDRPHLDEVPAAVRGQLAHSIRQLEALVQRTAAGGEPELASLIAAEQSLAFKRALAVETYENEVPDQERFRKHRLLVLAPPPRAARAVVLRSVQPARMNLDEVVAAAAEHDIKPEEIAIIDLRYESDRDTRWVRDHQDRDRSRIAVFPVPIVEHTVPTFEQVADMLRLLVNPRYRLVHIHCKGGRSRTGVVIAAMRIALDGWSVERALEEARLQTMWRPLHDDFVREFAARWHAGEITL